MQALLADLLPYFVAFFLLDAAANLRRGHLLLATELGRYHLYKAGLQLAGFAPGAEVLALEAMPLLIGERGLWRQAPDQPYTPVLLDPAELEFIAFESLGALTVEGKKLLRDDKLLLPFPSSARANEVGALLVKLQKAEPGARPALLRDAVLAASDLDAVRKLRRGTLQYGAYLAPLSWAFALCFFGLLPVTVFWYESTPLVMERVLAALGILQVAILLASGALLHASGLKPGAIASHLAALLFLPFTCGHPLRHLTRDLYARFHWSAVAAELMPRPDFLALARQELHRIALSRPLGSAHGLDAWWDLQRQAWELLVARLGTSAAALLGPVPRSDPDSELFCPLCSAEFRAGVDACHDCGVRLLPLAPPKADAPAPLANAVGQPTA